MRGLGVALAFSLLLVVAGCGKAETKPATESTRPTESTQPSESTRPSAQEIANSLLTVGDDPSTSYTAKEADCIAQILVGSDISDEVLQKIAAGEKGFEQSEEDKTSYRKLVRNISACLVDSLPAPSRTS